MGCSEDHQLLCRSLQKTLSWGRGQGGKEEPSLQFSPSCSLGEEKITGRESRGWSWFVDLLRAPQKTTTVFLILFSAVSFGLCFRVFSGIYSWQLFEHLQGIPLQNILKIFCACVSCSASGFLCLLLKKICIYLFILLLPPLPPPMWLT